MNTSEKEQMLAMFKECPPGLVGLMAWNEPSHSAEAKIYKGSEDFYQIKKKVFLLPDSNHMTNLRAPAHDIFKALEKNPEDTEVWMELEEIVDFIILIDKKNAGKVAYVETIDGITYDTDKAENIAHDNGILLAKMPGEHYFFVYSERIIVSVSEEGIDTGYSKITKIDPTSKQAAKAWLEMYGFKLPRKKKAKEVCPACNQKICK
jgi:hypothetical protein